MLGTVLVTELQRESRPIFRMQPVIRRKNRKAPHKTMITLIHMRSLQTGEKQHLYFERLYCLFVCFTPFNPSYHTSFRSHLLLLAFFVLLAVGPIDKDRKTDVAPPQLPCHVPIDAECVQPVERQRETHHCHDDRDGRDEVTQGRRGGRLDPDKVCTVVDMSIQDTLASKVTLMIEGGGGLFNLL